LVISNLCKRAGLRIVDDAPISRKESSLGRRDDVAHGRDAILEQHGFKTTAGAPHGGGLVNSKRPPEGEVEAVAAGQRVLALGQEVDAVECQAIRAAPDHDVAVDQRPGSEAAAGS